MKAYNKNFRPEFKILIDYINIKGLQNSSRDDVFIGEQELELENHLFDRYFKSKKTFGYLTSMFTKDEDCYLFFDEFLNFYCKDEDEETDRDWAEYYELVAIDDLELNTNLERILKILIELVEEDKEYRAYKLEQELKEKQTTKKTKI